MVSDQTLGSGTYISAHLSVGKQKNALKTRDRCSIVTRYLVFSYMSSPIEGGMYEHTSAQ